MRVCIYSDGACRKPFGNAPTGRCAVGVSLQNEWGHEIQAYKEVIAGTTNNGAEYVALIRGLQLAQELGATDVLCRCDSQLLVRQLTGVYQCRDAGLHPYYCQALSLSRSFARFAIQHIERRLNGRADDLANQALDGK